MNSVYELMKTPETLESERLFYSKIKKKDLDFFRDYLKDPLLTRYLPLGEPYPEKEIINYLAARIEHWQTHQFGIFMLELISTGETIGYGGLSYVGETEFIDIRYGIIQKYWGQGLAKEAATRILAHGFNELKLETIYGVSVPENSASAGVLKKIGMRSCSRADFYEDAEVDYYQLSNTDYQNR